MFCANCGFQIPDNGTFCPNCGAKVGGASITEKVTVAVDSVESSLNQAASGVEAGVGKALNNLEKDLNGAVREVADDLGIKAKEPTPVQGTTPPPVNNFAAANDYSAPNAYSAPNGNVPPNNGGGYYQQNFNQPNFNQPIYNGGVMLKTDRSLLVYILLSIVTCGIYGWYFIYKLAKDVNTCCDGDGENTAGLLMLILLSIVTCGIYSYIWFYKLGDRLNKNAYRYGMMFTENGTTVLMWQLFGVLLCGIGPFIAMNIIIKNTNALCAAYNNYNASPAN